MDFGTTIANAFDGTFAFLPTHKSQTKNAKEPPSQRTTTDQMNGQTTYRQEGRTANIKPNIQKPTKNLPT